MALPEGAPDRPFQLMRKYGGLAGLIGVALLIVSSMDDLPGLLRIVVTIAGILFALAAFLAIVIFIATRPSDTPD